LSGAMLTQALNLVGCVAPSASPPRPMPPSVNAKVIPAAPDTADAGVEGAVFDLNRHGLGLPGGALNGAHNARISATAADVAVHVGDDLLARRLLVRGQ
jgi:hypothetical protein